jgi:hypothetical protein
MSDRRRRRLAAALTVLATIVGIVAVLAVWAKRQALETDTWTETSTELLKDEEVQDRLSVFLVDKLYENVDVEARLQAALPPRAQPLATPAAAGLRELAQRAAKRALSGERVQGLWEEANERAHERFVALIVESDDAPEEVTLDLGPIAEEIGTRAGIDAAATGTVELKIINSDEVTLVQDIVRALRNLSVVLPLLALGLYGLAIYLAQGRRREQVRAAGIGFIVIGIAVLAALRLAEDPVVASLAAAEAGEPAVGSVFAIATSLLRDTGLAMFGYGLVIVAGAWLAGPTSWARTVRERITPVLADRTMMYAAIAVIVLLVLWWSPTEGTRRPFPLLILVALLIAGCEALRRQAMNDFPEAAAPKS